MASPRPRCYGCGRFHLLWPLRDLCARCRSVMDCGHQRIHEIDGEDGPCLACYAESK